MTNPAALWKYQHDDNDRLHLGNPTDARGLRLRQQSGYTHVHMGTWDGWLQIGVAIRKAEHGEKMAELANTLAVA